jgi:hypothetical protein
MLEIYLLATVVVIMWATDCLIDTVSCCPTKTLKIANNTAGSKYLFVDRGLEMRLKGAQTSGCKSLISQAYYHVLETAALEESFIFEEKLFHSQCPPTTLDSSEHSIQVSSYYY